MAWSISHVARADGDFRMRVGLPLLEFAESSADDGKWAHLVMLFDERFDGRGGVDGLDGMGERLDVFLWEGAWFDDCVAWAGGAIRVLGWWPFEIFPRDPLVMEDGRIYSCHK